MARGPWGGPVVAAGVAVATVLVAVLVARPAAPTVPPLPLDPPPPDRTALSLDRCAAALDRAQLGDAYPPRDDWRPVAVLAEPDLPVGLRATLVDAAVPFACVTGPTTVEVSDPVAPVPVAGALLLLTAPSGVVAAAGAGTVGILGAGDPVPRWLLGRGGAGGTTVVHDDRAEPAPSVAPPALAVVDRRELPEDRSAEATELLDRCSVGGVDRYWVPAVVLDGSPDTVLVATGAGLVGGCTVTSDGRATGLAVWRVGSGNDGPRPFVWLTAPGGGPPDLAAGPAQARVARMEVTAADGTTWTAVIGGRAFATRVPPGVDPDPRALTVRALDAAGAVLFEGPAVQ